MAGKTGPHASCRFSLQSHPRSAGTSAWNGSGLQPPTNSTPRSGRPCVRVPAPTGRGTDCLCPRARARGQHVQNGSRPSSALHASSHGPSFSLILTPRLPPDKTPDQTLGPTL